MATCSNGKFYLIDSTKNLLRSIDNGDTWELTPMSLTNGTFYSSYPYIKIHELPDGRLAMKWGIKPDGETQYSYHIIVSSDNGSTWESIDSDLDATYKYKSGTADRDKNDDNGNSAMWVTNGVVFNCVAFGNVDRNDGLEERMLLSHTTIYVLFYTTDIASGVWNYAGPAQSRCMNYGFYNPNDQRYFAVTDQGQIMCSSPGSLASDGWQWLDKAGFAGLGVQEMARFDFTVLDERNNRLVFMYPGTYTFDYYTMEPAIKGLGEDNYANRLVTYKDLDNYLRAPFTDRTGQNLNKDVTKLAFGFTRQNGKGKNSVNLINDQRNTLHRFYFVGSNHNDTAPKEGQVLASTKGTSSSNSYAPTVGRGGSGWIAVHRLDIYGNYVFQDYLNTGGVGYEPNEHAVAQSGALYFTGKTSYNGSESGYPYPYIIIPFTSWTYKRDCMWFGFTDSHIIWSARWHYNSTNYPQNWNDVKGNEYYLYDIVGFPLIQQNYGLSGHGSMSRKTRYNYNT